MPKRCVIKIGGSLLEMPGLPERIAAWLEADLPLATAFVVGGGAVADHVRRFDAAHGLGEQTGHWMAVRAMALNTALLASMLPGLELVGSPAEAGEAWKRGRAVLVQPLDWLREDERAGAPVPHRWTFTSDSIAAHVAHRLGARRLVLAKCVLPQHASLDRLAAEGVVDPCFAEASAGLASLAVCNLAEPDRPLREVGR